jgi:chorismate synthase
MAGNSIGNLIKVTSFGESHGPAMGVVIDGVPPQLTFNANDLQRQLDRRAPGRTVYQTDRNEDQSFEMLSGIFKGKTLGTPICIIIKNKNQDSSAYTNMKEEFRPGHADRTTVMKYGIRDHRGGGRASGRETVSRVIAGYFAGLILPQVQMNAYVTQIGPYIAQHINPNIDNELNFADESNLQQVKEYLLDCKQRGESAGGSVELIIKSTPAGLGEPCFDKLKADLAKAMVSIGSCVGCTFGAGVDFAHLPGSEISNSPDAFGGIEGGISNGEQIKMTLYFKAPSTVGKKAQEGRHDPCILPRVVPVVESMAKIVLADHYLRQSAYSTFL